MVRIYGISADQLDVIRPFVSDADEYESGLYVVQLGEDVRVRYSFGDVEIGDSITTVTLDSLDFEKIVID